MRLLKFLSLVCVAVSALSCVQNNETTTYNGNARLINAPLRNEEKTTLPRMNFMFEHIDTIFLSSECEERLIDRIFDVKTTNDNIFIQGSECIFLFSKSGQFISRIGHKGMGHGEYLSLDRFDISNDGRQLYVFDQHLNKIITYNQNGDFIRQIELDDIVFDFAVNGKDRFVLYNPVYYGHNCRRGLWELDTLGVFKSHLLSIDDDFRHTVIIDHYLVHINDSSTGLIGPEDYDLFYSIQNDEIEESYKVITDISMSKKVKASDRIVDRNSYTEYIKSGYFETDKLLQFDLSNTKGDYVKVIFDKSNDVEYRFYQSDYERITEVDEVFPELISSYNGCFIYCVTHEMVEYSSFFKLQFPDIDETSNPVLILAY